MQIIREDFDDPDSVGLFDETYHPKKGDKTPGVQRQWCGTKGTTDNCAVTVHLCVAAGDARGLVDSDLFLPEQTWSSDRDRCRAAGIPDDVVYRPKWKIALELLDRALSNGVRFGWLTFDAGYGMHSDFMAALDARGALYVGEVPEHLPGWTKAPPVMLREHASHAREGRPRTFPRIKVLPGDMHKAKAAGSLSRRSPAFFSKPWTAFRVKEDSKGPVVWEAKEAPFHLRVGTRDVGTPTWAHRLIIARHPLTGDTKHFVSNAPMSVPLSTLLRVAFTRWAVERCFQDAKGELGLSHFEVRNHTSLLRHLILTAVSFLFLARARAGRGGEKSEAHDLPAPPRDRAEDPRRVGPRLALA
jgi:SRSO17 transposase